MKSTDQAIDEYGLEFEVMAGSEASMVAALEVRSLGSEVSR